MCKSKRDDGMDFRHTRDCNRARVLKTKYCCQCNFLESPIFGGAKPTS